MRKFKLGKSEVEVSVLAFGTDLIGSRIDRETSFSLMDLYYESGGAFIDTGNGSRPTERSGDTTRLSAYPFSASLIYRLEE